MNEKMFEYQEKAYQLYCDKLDKISTDELIEEFKNFLKEYKLKELSKYM